MTTIIESLKKAGKAIAKAFSKCTAGCASVDCPPGGKELNKVKRSGHHAFLKDANGKIVAKAVDDPYADGHNAATEKFLLQKYELTLTNNNKVTAFKSLGALDANGKTVPDHRMDTDCHGICFTNGEYWVDNDEVDKMLGVLKPKAKAKPGDVLVYRKEQIVLHTVTVTKVDKAGNPTEVSGLGGIEMKEQYSTPEAGWDATDLLVIRTVWGP